MNATRSEAVAARPGRPPRRMRPVLMLVAAWSVTLAAAAHQAPPANPTGVAILEFKKRVDAYVELRRKHVSGSPLQKDGATPAQIDAREKEIADGVRAARGQARPGDIFGSAEPIIRKIVRSDWAKRPAADRSALLAEAPRVAAVTVNMTYPSSEPRATFPPTLLQELPKLPETIEYRFMGRRLVLLDVAANLIVDVIENALPSSR